MEKDGKAAAQVYHKTWGWKLFASAPDEQLSPNQ